MSDYKKILIFTDGGSRGNPGFAAAGIHVSLVDGQILYESSHFLGETTNNVAEYFGLIFALKWVQKFEQKNNVEKILFSLDSKLVVEQINGNWRVKEPHLKPLFKQASQLLSELQADWSVKHVPRDENRRADELVNEAVDAYLSCQKLLKS